MSSYVQGIRVPNKVAKTNLQIMKNENQRDSEKKPTNTKIEEECPFIQNQT